MRDCDRSAHALALARANSSKSHENEKDDIRFREFVFGHCAQRYLQSNASARNIRKVFSLTLVPLLYCDSSSLLYANNYNSALLNLLEVPHRKSHNGGVTFLRLLEIRVSIDLWDSGTKMRTQ